MPMYLWWICQVKDKKLALIQYSIFFHYQRENVTLLFSQGKITSFLHPRQGRQKDVGPEIKLKSQRVMSSIGNIKECF
jgi:hypothetical protein